MAQRRQDIAKLLEPLLSLPSNLPSTVSPPPPTPTEEVKHSDEAKTSNDQAGAQSPTTSDLKKVKRKQTNNSKPAKRRKKNSVTIDNFI